MTGHQTMIDYPVRMIILLYKVIQNNVEVPVTLGCTWMKPYVNNDFLLDRHAQDHQIANE